VYLIPLPDGRALMSFDQPRTIEDLELEIYDALDDPRMTADDRQIFQGIGTMLREARRSRDISLLRRSIIVFELPGRRGEPHLRKPRALTP
jgi:hypothetical protein